MTEAGSSRGCDSRTDPIRDRRSSDCPTTDQTGLGRMTTLRRPRSQNTSCEAVMGTCRHSSSTLTLPISEPYSTYIHVTTCTLHVSQLLYIYSYMFLHVGLHIGRAAYCVLIIRFGARRRNYPICFLPGEEDPIPSILVQLYTYMSIVLF